MPFSLFYGRAVNYTHAMNPNATHQVRHADFGPHECGHLWRMRFWAGTALLLVAGSMLVAGSAWLFADDATRLGSPQIDAPLTNMPNVASDDQTALPTEQSISVVPPQDAFGLQAIQDGTKLAPEDNSAYYGLLHQAEVVDEQALTAAASQFLASRQQQTQLPVFLDMLRNPTAYRGQPVTLKGHTLQVLSYEALENPWGITTLYEASFFEEDAQGNLATIIFLERPDRLPLGDKLVDGVTVTGYFLKLYHYDAEDKHTHKAPFLLARTLQVAPPPAEHGSAPAWLIPVVVVGVMFLIVLIVWVQVRDRRLSNERQRSKIPERIDGVDVP